MRFIKKKNIKYLLIGIVIILILFINIIDSKGQIEIKDPITYDFNNESILDLDQENIPSYYNIKNQSQYNGNYESEISFEKPLSESITSDLSDVNSKIEIVDYIYGHSKVLKQYDYGFDTQEHRVYFQFAQQNYGSLSFWFFFNNTENFEYFYLLNDGYSFSQTNILTYLKIKDGNLFSHFGDGIGGTDTLLLSSNILNNTWYYIDLVFDCSLDIYSIYLNNFLKGKDLNFVADNDFDWSSGFSTSSDNLNNGISIFCCLDGLDYSWSNNYYNLRNFISEKEITNYLEVDKYKFDYSNITFETDSMVWKQFEKDDTSDNVKIISNTYISNYISIWSWYGQLYSHGFDYTNIGSNSMIIDISFELKVSSISNNDFISNVFIECQNSFNASDFIKFKFNDSNQDFMIYNESSYAYESKFTYDQDIMYFIDIYMNFYDKILIYDITSDTDNLYEVYHLDYYNNGIYGVDNITINSICFELENLSSMTFDVYSIGIYEKGNSLIDFNNNYEFGLMYYLLSESWNSDTHNLLTIDCLNDYELYVYTSYSMFLNGYRLRERKNQTNLEIINLQDSFDNNYPKFIYYNPYLTFQLFGNFTNPYEIEIEGIRLIDNYGNYVYGNYYYNNSNPKDNWFYAIDNKLHYNFNNSDNVGLETMRISFNINDILLSNESLFSFSSYITNDYLGKIYLCSYHTIEIFNISNSESVKNTHLNLTDYEHFTLREILIEIQANSSSYNLSKGYIQNLDIYPEKALFYDFEPIEYLFSTFLEKMIETIIPLLFFIIPSILIKTRYGSKAVIPIWILMTFVFLIVGFIPFWICFVMFLGIGLMFVNKEKDVLD